MAIHPKLEDSVTPPPLSAGYTPTHHHMKWQQSTLQEFEDANDINQR